MQASTLSRCARMALMLAISLPVLPAQAADAGYAVTKRITLAGQGRWDYADIDPVRGRLYVTRGDHVDVVDLASGQPVGAIADTAGVHGVAFAQDLKLGFTSNGKNNTVTVFDLDTLKTLDTIAIPGVNPDAILYEPASRKLYTFNGKSNDVTVIEMPAAKVVATIKATGRPEFAVSDGAGKIFFNIEDHPGINVIDVAGNALAAKWELTDCAEPTGLAIDRVRSRLFSTCQNGVMAVTDARTGKRVARIAIGGRPDAAVFDPATGNAMSSNGAGTLTIAHQDDADHYSVAATVATEKGARTMAYDARSGVVYLPVLIKDVFTVLALSPKK